MESRLSLPNRWEHYDGLVQRLLKYHMILRRIEKRTSVGKATINHHQIYHSRALTKIRVVCCCFANIIHYENVPMNRSMIRHQQFYRFILQPPFI